MLIIPPPVSGWRKSSFSEAGNCVEVMAIQGKSVLIRDSKYGNNSIISVQLSTWQEFVHKIKHG